ncbi:MAG: c-type cytochrome [Sphingomonadaceae bacterium]
MRVMTAIAASAVLAGTMLAGCSQSGDETDTSEPSTEAVPDSTAETAPDATGDTAATTAAAGQAPPAFAQCAVCHSTKEGENGIGPSLAGVYGAKAAEIPGFQFSSAMQNSGLTFDDATLDAYLKNPMTEVPGTKMAYAGLKNDEQRKAVIEYLKTL